MTTVVNLSRREFVGGAAGLVLGFSIGFREFPAVAAEAHAGAAFEPNVYLTIDPSGDVTIVAHRSEMGTGIKTGLPMVLADELGADWTRVKIVQAQGDPKYGDQNTDGSRSTRQFYEPMRIAGASARQMLEAAAAHVWSVNANDCQARNHTIVHVPSGRQLSFGDAARIAATLEIAPPDHMELRFRPANEWRYVGKPVPIVDLNAIVRGKATYGIDVVLPGMKYASIERCPVYGGKASQFDATEAMKVPGVEQVVEIPATPIPSGFYPLGGIAVIASNTWSAQQGREKLKITWDFGPNASHDSTAYRAQLEATAKQPGRVVRNQGNVDAALGAAKHHIAADYFVPYYAHAPMEVPNAVAHFVDGKCEIWTPTQFPQSPRTTAAQVLGLTEEDVTVNVTLLGGAFGRKSKSDYVAEAALLSRKIGSPVKVTWTREDEIQHDYYHAISAQHLEAGLDAKGRPSAWLHRTVFPAIESTFQPDVTYGSAGELQQGVTDMPYAIANVRCENGPAANHVRIGWYRSVYNIPHAFAVCSFADELAHAAGKDPLEYLRELLGEPRKLDFAAMHVDYPNYGASLDMYPADTGRLRGVLDLVAQNSGWGSRLPSRHGRGVAVHRSFLSYAAAVVQVAVGADGQITIPRVDIGLDCGLVVNPDRVRAQLEGAVIMGISNALYSNISINQGRIEQSNFSDYLVARTDITPETHVHLVESSAPPGGVGEPGVPPIAPAICNAIFAATGKRIRALPIDPAQLKST
ncbi:molybdopterin cofactor-binding domain-containing protein [Bradyrhizobium sp. ARR65]|uniref:xanthine dehydrogenase family protein molybdopterin-binding subunit n=1 Tax=Bradyrhizobium sp. ARR65 TaxID=1040989 RepID=UPI00046744C3|nr:molybdopterin cofactor-binding domain-containing protein [Bradyrhizobium sp. ARR65]